MAISLDCLPDVSRGAKYGLHKTAKTSLAWYISRYLGNSGPDAESKFSLMGRKEKYFCFQTSEYGDTPLIYFLL